MRVIDGGIERWAVDLIEGASAHLHRIGPRFIAERDVEKDEAENRMAERRVQVAIAKGKLVAAIAVLDGVLGA